MIQEALIDIEIPQTEPVIVHQGRYRLWKKPDGGMHLVYQRDDSPTADHMELPVQFLRVAQMAGEGKLNPMQLIAEVMKLRNEM